MSSQLPQRLLLYLNTVRWLRLRQLGWLIYRRLRPVVNPEPVAPEPLRPFNAVEGWATGPEPVQRELRFLNVAQPVTPGSQDWHPAHLSRLWRYNLHYFDYLHWQVLSPADKTALIDDWIGANPPGCEDAWEPYTLSLRLVNWIKYFSVRRQAVPPAWADSLLYQAHWLAGNLEFHIQANHLLKNAKALLFAGMCFDGPVGRRLLATGRELFLAELREQFLPDGGHYERTPMYHSIALEDCLDVLNLSHAVPGVLSDAELAAVADCAQRAWRFLQQIIGGDGKLPLFNDTAHNIAPEPAALLAYGGRLLQLPDTAVTGPERICLPDSGLFGYRSGGDSLLVDCGAIGPPHQPGHTHCDMLSFELCLDGERLIVDSGVHGYEGDDTRHYLRSTAAHNTICVDGAEQSEIWGTFRVARRARPGPVYLSELHQGRLNFAGSHDGYLRLPQGISHHRRIHMQLAGRWHICDTLTGQGHCTAESHVHFAPGIGLQADGERRWAILRAGRRIAVLTAGVYARVDLQQGWVSPGFGIREPAMHMIIAVHGSLPLQIEYVIERDRG